MWKVCAKSLLFPILIHAHVCSLLRLQTQLDQVPLDCLPTSHCLFMVVIFFKFNTMSPSMNAFVFFYQILSCPAVMSLLSNFAYLSKKHPVDHHIDIALSGKVMSTAYGIWNLDFFRMAYSPFCFHSNMSVLQVLSLDYVIAVYPLCLVGLTYLLVKLHDKLACCFTRLNIQWKASNSLIEAFGTFFLLSYVKSSTHLLMFLCLFSCIMLVGKLLDCTHITMAHLCTLDQTIFHMQL